jgi:hypothetical protein
MRSSIQVYSEYDKQKNCLSKRFAEQIMSNIKELPDCWSNVIQFIAQDNVSSEPKEIWEWAKSHRDEIDEYLNQRFEVLSELSILGILADGWYDANHQILERALDTIERVQALWYLLEWNVDEITAEQWKEMQNKFVLSSDDWTQKEWREFIAEFVKQEELK